MNQEQPRLHIFTPCWGHHFTFLLLHGLGRSFNWPQNAETVSNSIWTFITDTESQASQLKALAKKIIPTCEPRVLVFRQLTQKDAAIGAIKMQGLLKAIAQCLEEKTPMLMATPDFIYGDGTISNMLAVSCHNPNNTDPSQQLCVSLAHMRVLPTILQDLEAFPAPTNARLLHFALDRQHGTWAACDITQDPNGIYHSGIAHRRLTGNLIAVQHQMPSPFLVNFTESDFKEFERWKGFTAPAFGEWDHNWPTKLIEEQRLRYIGSSDAACMIEVTEADKNLPPILPKKPGVAGDNFFLGGLHNKIQRQFISIFRHE